MKEGGFYQLQEQLGQTKYIHMCRERQILINAPSLVASLPTSHIPSHFRLWLYLTSFSWLFYQSVKEIDHFCIYT